ncbi:MAG: ABC transporter permease [Saprospiraceae bacterium]
MNKLWIIIQREYISRVTRKSFILATLLTPLGIALFFVVVSFIVGYESDDSQRIAVVDSSGILKGALRDDKTVFFKFEDMPLEALKEQIDQKNYDAILEVPPIEDVLTENYTLYYYAEDAPTLDIELMIRDRVGEAVRDYKIEALNLERKQLDALDTRIELDPEPLKEDGDDKTTLTSAIGAGIGTMMGFIMYLVVFVYGAMVMRSVMEEKTTRIVEVMISSVKPFQLMLGKIIGVGAVGLTQVAVWAILIPSLTFLAQLFFNIDTSQFAAAEAAAEIDPDDMESMMALGLHEIWNIRWWVILPLFVLYFLGGYFLYASMFAAVGASMGDDMGEGQSLTLPIAIPVVLALYIMIVTVQAPNSSLAVWSSIFPLFSPIVMPARLAFNPPFWEVFLSVTVLMGTSLLFVWLSGRVYRVGILMYGKKVTFKELGKWMFRKS